MPSSPRRAIVLLLLAAPLLFSGRSGCQRGMVYAWNYTLGVREDDRRVIDLGVFGFGAGGVMELNLRTFDLVESEELLTKDEKIGFALDLVESATYARQERNYAKNEEMKNRLCFVDDKAVMPELRYLIGLEGALADGRIKPTPAKKGGLKQKRREAEENALQEDGDDAKKGSKKKPKSRKDGDDDDGAAKPPPPAKRPKSTDDDAEPPKPKKKTAKRKADDGDDAAGGDAAPAKAKKSRKTKPADDAAPAARGFQAQAVAADAGDGDDGEDKPRKKKPTPRAKKPAKDDDTPAEDADDASAKKKSAAPLGKKKKQQKSTPSDDAAPAAAAAAGEVTVTTGADDDDDEPSVFAVRVKVARPGLYALFYYNCKRYYKEILPVHTSFDVDVRQYNVFEGDDSQTVSFLSIGDTHLPLMYLLFAAFFLVGLAFWHKTLRDASAAEGSMAPSKRAQLHRVHYFLYALAALKVLTLTLQAVMLEHRKSTGAMRGLIDWLFYTAQTLKGIMLFTVIVLLGSGWSIVKPFLSDRDRVIILVILPVQVLANIALAAIEETSEGSANWILYKNSLRIFDVVCCCAVVLPVAWTIQTFTTTAEGKNTRDLARMKQFRTFYLVVVAFVYWTRIVIPMAEGLVPVHLSWAPPFFYEFVALGFYAFLGVRFQPQSKESLLRAEADEPEGEEAIELGGARGHGAAGDALPSRKPVDDGDVQISDDVSRQPQADPKGSSGKAA